MTTAIRTLQRALVLQDFESAQLQNALEYAQGKSWATEQYIFPLQRFDAERVVKEFKDNDCRIISLPKLVKVGLNGVLISIATLMASHEDEDFRVNPDSVRIMTGMSNKTWEEDLKKTCPRWLKDKIFHHGQLKHSNLKDLRDGLILIDEIDSANQEDQVFHRVLYEAGLLDIKILKEKNIRIVVGSATMLKELYQMYRWGSHHAVVQLTKPPTYIGHEEFRELGLIKEWFPITTEESATRWIEEDILARYNDDYRVSFVRVNPKSLDCLLKACVKKEIPLKNHTSAERLTPEECKKLFEDSLTTHVVVAVKRLMSRADLIPWKKRIGAVMELYTKKVNNNCQIQGLVGRMNGHWKKDIEEGHLTGPFRTSLQAIKQYVQNYHDPFGTGSYQSAGFTKKEGCVRSQTTFLSPENILNLDAIDAPVVRPRQSCPITILKLDPSDVVTMRNKEGLMALVKRKSPQTYAVYKDFHVACWRVDTPEKISSWHINSLRKPNAWSSTANLTQEDKLKNYLLLYYYQDELIASPWRGAP
jgi:hypothetical protein